MVNTADLSNSEKTKLNFNERILIERVSILAIDDEDERKLLEEELTINLKNYLQSNKIFKSVDLFIDADITKKAKSLKLTFTEYKIVRLPHPDYFINAFKTFGAHIVEGGAIGIEQKKFAAEIEIVDHLKKPIFKKFKEYIEENNLNINSPNYINIEREANGADARTKLILQLLEEYKKSK